MGTLSRFSRQNDAGLRTLTVVLWENLVLVVVFVLESKAHYYLGAVEATDNCFGLSRPHHHNIPRNTLLIEFCRPLSATIVEALDNREE